MIAHSQVLRRVVSSLVLLAWFCPIRVLVATSKTSDAADDVNPFDRQVTAQTERLRMSSAEARSGAAEALGFLRAYTAADELAAILHGDADTSVRRAAAVSLAWCGGRAEMDILLTALDDDDWSVRQGTCVALNNLTGMQFPFDALAEPAIRQRQAEIWRQWWRQVADDEVPDDVMALLCELDLECCLRAVRALGALGGHRAGSAVLRVFHKYLARPYAQLDPLEKHIAQSCLCSLGRLRDPESLPALMDLLETADWARYAADALGDFGAREAVARMIAVYPRFSRDLDDPQKKPELVPADDRFAGNNTQDRMFETPFAIAQALVRLPLDDPDDLAALRRIGPFFLVNLPSDWDGGMLYEPEAFEWITAYLLERAGLRDAACEAAFLSAAHPDQWFRKSDEPIARYQNRPEECLRHLARKIFGDVPYMASWLPALCRKQHIPRLIRLLDHENGWVRINAIKSLMFLGDRRAIQPIARRLAESHPEADYGFSGVLEHAEYNSPAPRWRLALVRALGRFAANEYVDLLVDILENPRNVLDLQYAAAQALDELDAPKGLAALQRAEAQHPFHSVRLVAREAIWRRGIAPLERPSQTQPMITQTRQSCPDAPPKAPSSFVFIKGDKTMRSDFNGQAGVDPWRQTYTINNPAPTMRVGRNLYVLKTSPQGNTVSQLTHFKQGFVADCEVSWDGTRILFSHRRNNESRNYSQVPHEPPQLSAPNESELDGPNDPWWHIWEIHVDGTELRQVTHGPYHDVQPIYLPDGRIVFSSTRLGLRDEYHSFPSTGLSVMSLDGTNIHVIGFNLGGDREPAVMPDGRIVFSRLDVFYSRLKTEVTIQSTLPDGSRNVAFYGPERRGFWKDVHQKYAAWTVRSAYGGESDNRNRVLRLTQPQPLDKGRVICASSGGLVILGPGRTQETLVPHDHKWAVTSPFPLSPHEILCAATIKQFNINGRIITCGTSEFETLEKGPSLFRRAINIDLGLYRMNLDSGDMTLLYNDVATADFEARPIMSHALPKQPAELPAAQSSDYTARLFCASANKSRFPRVQTRAKLLRVVEGQPIPVRNESQTSQQPNSSNRWKNHAGTLARVLGTVPLAADGSFYVEVPADRLLQLQVLDSDRRVLSSQTFWMYARPGETRSCIGCHEPPDTAVLLEHPALSLTRPPIKTLPHGDEFSYRAKLWLKGVLPDEAEDRTRTVRAVNLIGRR